MTSDVRISRKRIQATTIAIMTVIALAVAVSSFAYLYKIRLEESRVVLQELVKSQARIYESIAKFNAIVMSRDEGGTPLAGTLSQIKEAHIRYSGWGETGEIVLAERVGDEIVFLLPTRKNGFEVPEPVPWGSDAAGPMQLALAGGTGTVRARDYNGDEVLAAYEYLPFLEMGLVAAMDIAEIRKPFLMGALYTSIVAWLAILIGALLNLRIVGPLVGAITEANTRLKQSEERLRNVSQQLSKFISPQLYESIFEGRKSARIESHRQKLTVFFSDVVGFTEKSDAMEPEDLRYVINGYLDRMAKVVVDHGGTLDKFVGDSVIVFFGDPESHGVREDARRCVAMALAMREAIGELKVDWREHGIEADFDVRMGIATGFCTVGNFGSEDRMEYTILGNPVNLASRLETNAQPGEILISQETATLVEEGFALEQVGAIQVKGFARPVRPFRVVGSREAAHEVAGAESGLGLDLDLDAVPDDQREALARRLREALAELEKQKD